MVSVKNHSHGSLNPKAQYGKPVTLEEVLASPMVVDPLSRLDCCPQGDGAAALVICRQSSAKKRTAKPIYVASSVLLSGGYRNPPELARWETDFRASEKAYNQAGLGPADLDLVELHDAFTIAEIMHYEGLGLCPAREGGRLIREGITKLGGSIPLTPAVACFPGDTLLGLQGWLKS
jgi:acetyl-CoA acetyltransferase